MKIRNVIREDKDICVTSHEKCNDENEWVCCTKVVGGLSVRGSLSIEAALIIPMFMFAMLFLISLITGIVIKTRLHNCTYEKARELSLLVCDGRNLDNISIREELVQAYLQEKWMSPYIEEKEGPDVDIYLSDSRDYTKITLFYHFKPLFLPEGVSLPTKIEMMFHNWVGYIDEYHGVGSLDEIVYVAKNASVYHRDRGCSYIRIEVIRTTPKEVVTLRNEAGGKYKQCRLCHSSLDDRVLFVTRDGDRYHKDINCSACKRLVRAVRLREVSNLRPCSRCGGI